MTTTSTEFLADSLPRRQAIREIRENLKYLFLQGGSQAYPCEALAHTVNQISGTTFGKNTIRKFFFRNHEIKGRQPNEQQIVNLLLWTRTERKKVESILSGAFNNVIINVQVTPDLQDDFKSVVDQIAPLSSEQMKQVSEFIRTLK